MKTFDHPNKKFMSRFERYEPIIQDYTQMNLFDQCDRKYFYRIVLGRVPLRTNNQAVLDFGTAYHKFREVLEREHMNGKGEKFAFGSAIEAALAIPIDIPPRGSKWEYLDKAKLMEACGVAFEWWKQEKKQGTKKVIAIEQPFNVMLPDGSFIGGRADQIIDWNGKRYGRDFKTSSKSEEVFRKGLDPNDQCVRYTVGESEISGERIVGIIFEALYHSKTGKTRIGPELSERTDSQLNVWLTEKEHINRQLKLDRDYDIWPMRTSNCSWCDYHQVCTRSNEQAQMAYLEQHFKLQPWDHTNTQQEVIE